MFRLCLIKCIQPDIAISNYFGEYVMCEIVINLTCKVHLRVFCRHTVPTHFSPRRGGVVFRRIGVLENLHFHSSGTTSIMAWIQQIFTVVPFNSKHFLMTTDLRNVSQNTYKIRCSCILTPKLTLEHGMLGLINFCLNTCFLSNTFHGDAAEPAWLWGHVNVAFCYLWSYLWICKTIVIWHFVLQLI